MSGIKYPLEYLQVQVTTLVSSLFIIVIPTDCKITNFSLCLFASSLKKDYYKGNHWEFGGLL